MNITDFRKNNSISMVTCYDYTFAKVLDKTDVDCVLVGDSVAMVIYGEESTTYATPKMIARHVKAVRKGYRGFIVADLPFLSLQKNQTDFLQDVRRLINAGASAVKIEGLTGSEDRVKLLVDSGVPVVGHVGLTPQFVNSFGGFKVQGRDQKKKEFITEEAKVFEELGAFMVVIECVPTELSKSISECLKIPTVGIGAGSHTDGQVLVLHDLLGLTEHKFRFVKKYEDLFKRSVEGVQTFKEEVKEKLFPKEENSFQ